MVLFHLRRVYHGRLWKRTSPYGHLLVENIRKVCTSFLAPLHLVFRHSFTNSCHQEIPNHPRNGHCLDLDRFGNVVGTVCHHRSHVDKTENARGGGLLHSYLGGVVHSGRLHLSLHAPLHSLYKSLSHRSHLGDQRR